MRSNSKCSKNLLKLNLMKLKKMFNTGYCQLIRNTKFVAFLLQLAVFLDS